MNITNASVTRPAPGVVRLAVDINQVDDKAAQTVEVLAADLKAYGADGKIAPEEGVKIVGDVVSVLAPANVVNICDQIEPAVLNAVKDGVISRADCVKIGLTLAMSIAL